MAIERECPKCGATMQSVDDDPDTGIVGGWDCECGHTESIDPNDFAFDEPPNNWDEPTAGRR